jgi:hypothetical protein
MEPDRVDQVGSCGFMSYQPRYYQVLSTLSLQNAAVDEILVNDALIRTLRRRLMVAECQLILSEGTECTSGTPELPCTEPVHYCYTNGQETVLTNDVHTSIALESCDNNGDGLVDRLDGPMNTLACDQVLELGEEVQMMVKGGKCAAICDLDAFIGGNSTEKLVGSSRSCLSFDLIVNVATEQAASGILDELVSTSVQEDVQLTLGGFGGSPLIFNVVQATVGDAVGFGFFPPPPPPPPPLRDLVSPPNLDEATGTAELRYGKWSSCYPSCGDGFMTRTVSCVNSEGVILPLGNCPGGLVAQSSRKCSTPCDLPYWQYGPWQTCNRRCGTGESSRTAICVSDGVTKCSEGAKEPLTRECNTAPCELFSWVQTNWSKCSSDCGGGTQVRNVTCVDSQGAPAPSSSCNDSLRPPNSRVCNSQSCDICDASICLGRGECTADECDCSDKYSGSQCEVHSSCSSGIVDSLLECCKSGVLDSSGTCCPEGSTVDNNGACCKGVLDICGVCNGDNNVVDIQGQCCNVVDADGICCSTGLIDECGVCNGIGNTCNIILGVNLRVPSEIVADNGVQPASIDAYLDQIANLTGIAAARISLGEVYIDPSVSNRRLMHAKRALLQSPESSSDFTNLIVQVEIAPDVTQPTDVPFSSAYYADIISEASSKYGSEKFGIEGIPFSSRSGVCGNGICELGERPAEGIDAGTCPEDCGLPTKVCLDGCSNGGVCLPASGVCQCRAEYDGPSCSECAEGYARSGGACTVNVAEKGLISSSVLGSDGHALVSGESSSGTSAGVIIAAVFGSLAGTVLLVIATILIRRRCAYSSKTAQYVENTSYPKKAPESPELCLRKKYGLSPHGFGYNDNENSDRIPVGEYNEEYTAPTNDQTIMQHNEVSEGIVDHEHGMRPLSAQISYITHTVPLTSSDDHSGFQTNLYIKDPSPDKIHHHSFKDPHVEDAEQISDRIKAATMHLNHGHCHPADSLGAAKSNTYDAAESIERVSPGMRSNYLEERRTSIGSESRMVFNPTFSMDAPDPGEYERTIVTGQDRDLGDLETRRQKLDALRAAVKSLEHSCAPSRESSFSMADNIVDLESLTEKDLPERPSSVPGLNLSGMNTKSPQITR